MSTIITTINNFYQCSMLAVRVISSSFEIITDIGYTADFEKHYSKIDFCSYIKNITTDFDKHLVTYNDVSFLIVPISKYNNNKGYYIIGPFKTIDKYADKACILSLRSKSSIEYLYKLLINIHEDIFSKGRINSNYNIYIKKAVQYVMNNYSYEVTVDLICKELNINKSYFCKIFKSETGYTFSNYLNIFRIEKSKELLKNTDMSLLDIAISVGYNSQNYYTVVFKKITDITPNQFRNT